MDGNDAHHLQDTVDRLTADLAMARAALVEIAAVLGPSVPPTVSRLVGPDAEWQIALDTAVGALDKLRRA